MGLISTVNRPAGKSTGKTRSLCQKHPAARGTHLEIPKTVSKNRNRAFEASEGQSWGTPHPQTRHNGKQGMLCSTGVICKISGGINANQPSALP
eukprot:4546995-Amphidinium_carterae.1